MWSDLLPAVVAAAGAYLGAQAPDRRRARERAYLAVEVAFTSSVKVETFDDIGDPAASLDAWLAARAAIADLRASASSAGVPRWVVTNYVKALHGTMARVNSTTSGRELAAKELLYAYLERPRYSRVRHFRRR